MQDFDVNELIGGYIDGELSADQRSTVERLLAENAEYRKLHDELLAVRSQLHLLPTFSLPADFSERIVRRIQSEAFASNVVSVATEEAQTVQLAALPVTSPAAASSPLQKLFPAVSRKRALFRTFAASTAAALVVGVIFFRSSLSPEITKLPPPKIKIPVNPPIDPDEMAHALHASRNKLTRWTLSIDISITPLGQRRRVLETLLGKYGIRVEESLRVDDRLESTILQNRVVGDVKVDEPLVDPKEAIQNKQDRLDNVELIYVEMALDPAADQALNLELRALSERKTEIAKLRFDLLLGLQDQDVFEHLHRAAEQFAKARSGSTHNQGFRLQFRSGLYSGPGAFAAITAPSISTPPLPFSEDPKAPVTHKNGIQVPPSRIKIPTDKPVTRDSESAVIDQSKLNQKPSLVLFIVRNLKRELPASNATPGDPATTK